VRWLLFPLSAWAQGAGLTVTVKGDEVMKGLLPLANKGLCCIDELNLMKERDRAGLLNAMEKGFVSYDKANKHIQLQANVKVLATANPKGDRFAGWIVETLKKQLPFDPALLSRFHIVFLIRRPDIEKFVKITKKIVSEKKPESSKEDLEFVKEYVKYIDNIKPEFNKALEPMITAFVEEVKKDEKKFMIEVSPRIVLGIVRMSKASARMHMRDTVTKEDVHKVLWLLRNALDVGKKETK